MRTLLAVCALQSLLLLYLLLRPFDDAPPVAPAPRAVSGAFLSAAPAVTGAVFDEARLRQIIREELAAGGGSVRAEPLPPRPRDPELDQQRLAEVEARIQHFRGVGRMTEQQMQELQRDIALLDGAGQRAALSQLTRAMNAREIKAQL